MILWNVDTRGKELEKEGEEGYESKMEEPPIRGRERERFGIGITLAFV